MNTFKVKIFDAQGTKSLSVAKASFCIGSSNQSDIVLVDPTIQGEHVRVWCEGGRLWIQDLGTSQGTSINDMRLPPLKPMLCREIDTLKLGDSPFTISIEPVFVRAPQVKPAEPPKAVTKAAEAEQNAEERRQELAKFSRELADLRLQIQMARLEKDGVEEIKKYRETVQEQIQGLEVKKSQMLHEMAEWEKDKVIFRKRLDMELAELRAKTEKELKKSVEDGKRSFEEWRVGRVEQIGQAMTVLMDRLILPLVGKPFAASQFRRLEKEFSQIVRDVLLNQVSPDDTVAEFTQSQANLKRPEKRSIFERLPWRKFSWGAGGAAAFVATLLAGWSLYSSRMATSSLSASSTAPSESPAPSREVARYMPPTTADFKRSYTDNVLFTTRFAEREQNSVYRSRLTAELKKVSLEWQWAPQLTNAVATKDLELVRDLTKMKESIPAGLEKEAIGRMRSREAVFQSDLLKLLQSRDNVERFIQFKRNFYVKNQNLSVASAKEEK